MALPVLNISYLWRLARNAALIVIASRVTMVLYSVGVVVGLGSGFVYIINEYAPNLNVSQYFGDVLTYINSLDIGYADVVGYITALDVGVELWEVGFKFTTGIFLAVITVCLGYLSFRFYVAIRNAIVNDILFKT